MEEQRSNFYILLDLNPDHVWDQNLFEQALKAKQAKWNQERMGWGKNVLIARKNIELIPEIERVMNDIVLRTQEARAAQENERDQAEKREARLMDFERQLHSAQQKGYLTDDEVATLISTFDDVLTEDEVIRQINVPVLSPHDDMSTALEELSLSASIIADIDEKLKLLNMSSLYQLLRLQLTASLPELSHAAERVHDDFTRRQPKTVEVTAGAGLAGHAKHIFSSEKMRQYYDEHLKQHAKMDKTAQQGPSAAVQQEHTASPVKVGDIGELRVRNIGTALRLTWSWPDQCYQTLVAFSNEAWPEPQQSKGTVLQVTKAEYEAGGHYDLYAPLNYHYFIRVIALLCVEGKLISTDGDKAEGYLMPHIIIKYEIKNPGLGRKQRTLHLYTSMPSRVPTLVLRCKRNGQPLKKSEGEELHREVGPIDIVMEKVIPLPNTPFPETYVRLFLENDDFYTFVTIYHPHERKLRLK